MNNASTTKAIQSKTVAVWDVRDRDHVRFGRKHPGTVLAGQHAEITPGVSIRLFGTKGNLYVLNEQGERVPGSKDYDRTFRVGDVAEYDSYNMHFTGTITAIGEKRPSRSKRATAARIGSRSTSSRGATGISTCTPSRSAIST